MNFEMSEEERDVLKHVLKHYVGDLKEEIHRTKDRSFKKPLKREEDVIKEMMVKLEA
jgi:hypothetical protein